MGSNSAIEWCDATFNPWWGCLKVSPGCANCYADTLATRYGFTIWGPAATTERRLFGENHWQEPLRWNAAAAKAGVRKRVFCASMADVFEDNPQVEEARFNLWRLIEATPMLDWLLLTKRPENIEELVPLRWVDDVPQSNVWYGTSVENQEQADTRIPILLAVPAVVRFLSCEPLLGPVDLRPYLWEEAGPAWAGLNVADPGIHWIITGGESGAKARHCDPAWVRSIRDQCQEVNAVVPGAVAFFHKQWGGRIAKSGGRLLDGRTWDELPQVMHLVEQQARAEQEDV